MIELKSERGMSDTERDGQRGGGGGGGERERER